MDQKSQRNNNSEIISNYIKQRDEYLQNAETFYGKHKYRKSSEMLWGAITQTIKAIAAISGIRIIKHNEFFDYIKAVSSEIENEYYYSEFLKINDLHRNFYDEFIPPDSYDTVYREALKYLEKLNELLEERIIEKTKSLDK